MAPYKLYPDSYKNWSTSTSTGKAPHVVEVKIDINTNEVKAHQCTPKEDAIHEIKRQPYF